jgi:Zn-dependent protease with chaperone function
VALASNSNPTTIKNAGDAVANPRQHPLVTAIPERLTLPRPGRGYQVALGVVAVVMMLLPLVYLALIAGIAWAVQWHLRNNFDMVTASGVRGRGVMFLVLVFLAPAIIGGAIVIVMLKPLLAWPRRRERPRPVAPEEEPVLFAAVERLCRALGSPVPHQVFFANDANASASFQSLGDLLFNRLTLVIGLPLVAGLPARNLLGVLAHEFGHFNQYWAMRLGWIIHAINHWFTRVAQERDAWDEWLETNSRATDIRLGWILYLTRGGIWLTRQILRGLRWIGVLVSRRLSRQMEYDADACEAALIGSAEFAGSMRQITELAVASDLAEQELNHLARERRLVDNIPRLIVAQARHLPDSLRQHLDEAGQQTSMSWDDTHPPNRLRIEHVVSLNQPCRYGSEEPATALFVDFDRRCEAMAREMYEANLERPITADELLPVDRAIEQMAQSAANHQRARDYVGGLTAALNLLVLDEVALSTNKSATELWSGLRKAREEQEHYHHPFREASQRETELVSEREVTELLVAAIALKQPTSEFRPASADRPIRGTDAAIEHLQQVIERRHDALVRGLPFRRAWSGRLQTALQLLETPETAALLPETPRLRARIQRLWPTLLMLSETVSDREQIETWITVLGYLLSRAVEQRDNPGFGEYIGGLTPKLLKILERVWSRLSQVEYPESLDPAPDHLAAFCLPGIRDGNNPIELVQACHRLTSTARKVWSKSLGQAIEIACEVEAAWQTAPPAAAQISPAGETVPLHSPEIQPPPQTDLDSPAG